MSDITRLAELTRQHAELTETCRDLQSENDRHRSLYVDAVKERNELRADRVRLLESATVATEAADAAAMAVGSMAEKLSATLAENNRLRAVVDAARAACDTFGDWWMSGDPETGDRTDEKITNGLTRAMSALLAVVRQLDATPTGEGT